MATLMEYMDDCLVLRRFECRSLFVPALPCEEMALKQRKQTAKVSKRDKRPSRCVSVYECQADLGSCS